MTPQTSFVVVAPPETAFPDPESAPASGLVAFGGELTVERLIDAYSSGVFPWFDSDAEPVQWWSPDPRAVLELGDLRISRSLAKRLRRREFDVTMDTAFEDVVARCAAPRRATSGTWITHAMQRAYLDLHVQGCAHSVEAWHAGELVGGLYGVSLGRMFFGESMFAEQTDASKFALVYLIRQLHAWSFDLVDCQIMNDHLASLGASTMPRRAFLQRLKHNRTHPTRMGPWRLEVDLAG
ncbi:MAG: leucyl/phenylalanyl-tRNA--protein transferase [Gammaproteobacteria bacterium]|nr:leucyl/phenylalanyl-tRNA--protein transferase [Gammaproteobacteria bacterium]